MSEKDKKQSRKLKIEIELKRKAQSAPNANTSDTANAGSAEPAWMQEMARSQTPQENQPKPNRPEASTSQPEPPSANPTAPKQTSPETVTGGGTFAGGSGQQRPGQPAPTTARQPEQQDARAGGGGDKQTSKPSTPTSDRQDDAVQQQQARQLQLQQQQARQQALAQQKTETETTEKAQLKRKKGLRNAIDIIRFFIGGGSGMGEGCCSAPALPFLIAGPWFYKSFIKSRTETEKKDDDSMAEKFKIVGLLGCQIWSCFLYLGIIILTLFILYVLTHIVSITWNLFIEKLKEFL